MYELDNKGDHRMNPHGERQLKLDVLANNIFKEALASCGAVAVLASEEDELPTSCRDGSSTFTDGQVNVPHHGYAIVFDPLDGSGNVASGLPTGSIFGVYRSLGSNSSALSLTTDPSLCQKGTELVAAGYCLYSTAAHLVVTARCGVHMFALDEQRAQFVLCRRHWRIPASGRLYSLNEAYSPDFSPALACFLADLKAGRLRGGPQGAQGSPPTARYTGALVADIHNILLHGGIFGYPATARAPRGKLRLAYEANPIAAVLEDAGGRASDGKQRILDVPVEHIHQRTPLFAGSVGEVTALEAYLDSPLAT
eukprot:gene39979-48700_t